MTDDEHRHFAALQQLAVDTRELLAAEERFVAHLTGPYDYAISPAMKMARQAIIRDLAALEEFDA